MQKQRKPFIKHYKEKLRKETQLRLIEERKNQALNHKRRKEAVRTIERYWGFILLRRELMEKKKMWANLPLDCRLLWMRFSVLKEQAFDLRETIRDMNSKID